MADNEKQPSNVETFVDKLASGDNTGVMMKHLKTQ